MDSEKFLRDQSPNYVVTHLNLKFVFSLGLLRRYRVRRLILKTKLSIGIQENLIFITLYRKFESVQVCQYANNKWVTQRSK
jgi:hypothetical protein